jgi:endo-1,4-beta-xylanase
MPRRLYGANVDISAEMREELNPYPDSLPAAQQEELADRYADFFRIFKKHEDKVARITFWGVSDRSSWLNNWPVRGRTNYPLLFDRQQQPKHAFYSVMEVAKE